MFERWVEQTAFGRRALFTVPTRALANDKFAEWRARGWEVGVRHREIERHLDRLALLDFRGAAAVAFERDDAETSLARASA